jgi:hypothetical protein
VAASRAWHAIAARSLAWQATPGRVRLLAAASITAAALLAAVIAVAFSATGGSLRMIGGTDAPEVTSATGLYFSLSDMDAQVANMLLAGSDPALASARPAYLSTYDQDRANAYSDLQQAAVTAAGNPAAEAQLHTVLNDTAQYEGLAADALLADQQALGQQAGPAKAGTTAAPAGVAAPAAALVYYRQATDLMRVSILPQVTSVTTVATAKLDASYSAGRSDAGTGEAVAFAAGLALVAVLAGFQVFLTRRFRRRINPALAAATLAAAALTVTAGTGLGAESSHLYVAKSQAFDSVVALSQARAVGYAANADESRYLVDPNRAGQYQARFLAESQDVASVGTTTISGYKAALATDVSAYQANNANVPFGGYLGTEFRNFTFPGERAAAVAALLAYQRYQQDDTQLRTLAQTDPRASAEYDTSTAPGQSNWAFTRYDSALTGVIAINQNAFTAAISAGEGGASGWNGLVPAGCALLVAALVIVGVRPRLAEYR